MNDAITAFSGTGEVRECHRFDEERLFRWMAENVAGFAGPLEVSQFKGGQSNPTYRLDTPDRSYVLRRKPPGNLLKGAHAVEREARTRSARGTFGALQGRVGASEPRVQKQARRARSNL